MMTETPATSLVEVTPTSSAPASPESPSEVHVVLSVPAGVRARLTVEVFPDAQAPALQQTLIFPLENSRLSPASNWSTRLRTLFSRRNVTLETVLFSLALGVYLATRLIGLEDFPNYFFVD